MFLCVSVFSVEYRSIQCGSGNYPISKWRDVSPLVISGLALCIFPGLRSSSYKHTNAGKYLFFLIPWLWVWSVKDRKQLSWFDQLLQAETVRLYPSSTPWNFIVGNLSWSLNIRWPGQEVHCFQCIYNYIILVPMFLQRYSWGAGGGGATSEQVRIMDVFTAM
jgi:hypothetical protein